jgi:hypothetical protein
MGKNPDEENEEDDEEDAISQAGSTSSNYNAVDAGEIQHYKNARGGGTIRLVATLSLRGACAGLWTPVSSSGSSSPSLTSPRSPRPSDVLRPFINDSCNNVALAVTAVRDGQWRPRLVELDEETDLNVPPPGWLASPPAASELAARKESAVMTGALADMYASEVGSPGLSDAADFVASSSTMSALFQMPLSSTSVSITVHRVDSTLVLNGIVHGKAQMRGRFSFSPQQSQTDKEFSAHRSPEDIRHETSANTDKSFADNASTPSTARRKSKKKDSDRKSLFSKFMCVHVAPGMPRRMKNMPCFA